MLCQVVIFFAISAGAVIVNHPHMTGDQSDVLGVFLILMAGAVCINVRVVLMCGCIDGELGLGR